MSSTAAASSLWFGELAAAVQGGWQAMAVADNRGGQQKKLTRATGPSCEQKQEAAAVAEAAVAGRKDGDVGRCCGAMSDTTVYLLLDRFAPN